MVLDKGRGIASKFINPIASKLSKVNPNAITSLSLIFSIIFVLTMFYSMLLISFLLLLFSSFFDALDGAIARIANKTSKLGDFLDHLFDRYSDFLIILGISISIYGNILFGLIALAGTFMTSYVGTQAQAVGLGRFYGGFPGRADRLVIFMLGLVLQYFTGKIFGYYILSWVLLFIGIAGLLNSAYRSYKVIRSI